MLHHPDYSAIQKILQGKLESTHDHYTLLNNIRDWMNRTLPDFELYLEDVWNEPVAGETRFEYILRSKKTLNETEPLGYDIYNNHRDAKGVWHLDDYRETVLLIDSPEPIMRFLQENEAH